MHPDLMPAGETSEDCDGEKYKRFGFHPPALARGLPADRVKYNVSTKIFLMKHGSAYKDLLDYFE